MLIGHDCMTPVNLTGVAEGRTITPWEVQDSNRLEGGELVNERT